MNKVRCGAIVPQSAKRGTFSAVSIFR